MKLNFIFLLILYLFSSKKCENETKENIKEEEEKVKEQLNEEEKGIMTDEVFEKKLKQFLEDKHLTKKKKIPKEILQQIFNYIYEKDFDLPDLPDLPDKDNMDQNDMNPKFESKQFLNEIFNKLARSLDYDDEIKVKEIKDWISPNRVKEAMNEIVENLLAMLERNAEL